MVLPIRFQDYSAAFMHVNNKARERKLFGDSSKTFLSLRRFVYLIIGLTGISKCAMIGYSSPSHSFDEMNGLRNNDILQAWVS
jgi:hypothetical protein